MSYVGICRDCQEMEPLLSEKNNICVDCHDWLMAKVEGMREAASIVDDMSDGEDGDEPYAYAAAQIEKRADELEKGLWGNL